LLFLSQKDAGIGQKVRNMLQHQQNASSKDRKLLFQVEKCEGRKMEGKG
jgi:hypothetical protein